MKKKKNKETGTNKSDIMCINLSESRVFFDFQKYIDLLYMQIAREK